jgi:hypothetical protein
MAMPTMTTEDLVRRSFVRHLRRAGSLVENSFTGGEHEHPAPRNSGYPLLTYRLVAAPYVDDFTKRTIRSWWDIEIWSKDQVEAGPLDAAVMNELEESVVGIEVPVDPSADPEDPETEMTTQTILYCRRIAGLRDKETTDEGETVYRVGGTYSIWSDQPLRAASEE